MTKMIINIVNGTQLILEYDFKTLGTFNVVVQVRYAEMQ